MLWSGSPIYVFAIDLCAVEVKQRWKWIRQDQRIVAVVIYLVRNAFNKLCVWTHYILIEKIEIDSKSELIAEFTYFHDI